MDAGILRTMDVTAQTAYNTIPPSMDTNNTIPPSIEPGGIFAYSSTAALRNRYSSTGTVQSWP
jgi:hypothetical protein